MTYKTNISIGAPPILWSDMQQAFDEINQNFLELGIVVGSALDLEPLNFNNLESSVGPNNSNEFSLGSTSKTWKSLFVAEWFDIPGNQLNGVWLGDAQIRGSGTHVDLPANSTVDGELIINPANTSFKTVAIPTQPSIVADSFTDTLNINSTLGISLITDAATDTLTIGNSGVRSVQGSTYIGVSAATGDGITFTNQGVTNLTAGAGIQLNNPTGGVEITNTGIRGITPGGGGITVFIDPTTRVASIGNTAPVTRSFSIIRVPGQADLEADITSDILQVHPGYGISLATSEPIGESERLTISFDNKVDIVGSVFADDSSILVNAIDKTFRGDLNGSVFSDNSSLLVDAVAGIIPAAVVSGTFTGTVVGNITGDTTGYHTGDVTGSIFGDDSTKIVDAVENKVFGGIFATTLRTEETKIALGSNAGNTNQGANGVAIGWVAGGLNQGNSAVAVGVSAGNIAQGSNSVAMGPNAGNDLQGNNAIAIGPAAGFDTQGNAAISIGNSAGYDSQGSSAIAIGSNAGATNQGNLSIAIGSNAGNLDQPTNSIIISATGGVLNAATSGLFIAPIRNSIGDYFLQYDPGTGEITYNSTLTTISADIIGSVFADDSTILVNASDGSFSYIPVTPGDWAGTAPTTVGEAIDRLATLVKALNSGTGA